MKKAKQAKQAKAKKVVATTGPSATAAVEAQSRVQTLSEATAEQIARPLAPRAQGGAQVVAGREGLRRAVANLAARHAGQENARPAVGPTPGPRTGGATTNAAGPTANDFSFLNPGAPAFLIRQNFLDLMMDPRHNIDRECGYPPEITPLMYHLMYQRFAMARRVVDFMPSESWAMRPVLYEAEDENRETPFEQDWNALLRRIDPWYWLHRIDRLSGIGRFGCLLLGLDDGRAYSEPAAGLDDRGLPAPVDRKTGKKARPNRLLFMRAFDETAAQVLQREVNPQNPRYGLPTRYLVTFRELDVTEPAMLGTTAGGMVTSQVHWTRMIHVADNRDMSEIYGVPRMKAVWNQLQDARKTLGGAAEMFWKGAFPGFIFETQPGEGREELDEEALRDQMARWSDGLDRYMALTGMTAKSLPPQVADPKNHMEVLRDEIAFALGVPKRILFGSEAAHQASTQDQKTWLSRVDRRREDYLGPMLVRPFVDRLIALGVIRGPAAEGEYNIHWPDLYVATDAEKADLALKRTQTLQAYAMGQCQDLVPPDLFLTLVFGLEREELEEVNKALAEYLGVTRMQGAGVSLDAPVDRQGQGEGVAAGALGQEPGEGEGSEPPGLRPDQTQAGGGHPEPEEAPGMEGGSGGAQIPPPSAFPETARATKRKGISVKQAEAQAINPAEQS